MTATEAATETQAYASAFARAQAAPNEPAWLRRLRASAMERFTDLGFPSTRLEDWKYTDVSPIAATAFHPTSPDGGPRVRESDVGAFAYGDDASPRLVFVDGRCSPALSTGAGARSGWAASGLAQAVERDPAALEPHLGRHAAFEQHAFRALNLALFEDGAFVTVAPGTVVPEPLQLLYVSTATATPAVAHPRNLVLVGEDSQLRVVETHASLAPGDVHFTNAVTEIVLAPGAVLDHVRVQRSGARDFHVATVEVRQARDSAFTSHAVDLGGALARNDLNVRFDGEGAECTLNGLFVLGGRQHVDHHTQVDHARPRCTSREYYKGVLDGSSRGVFYGKVFIRKDAQKTNASQTNKNLLLSDGALVDSTPALEINADDVKASHGSTIGQLDKDALFYLRARGIGESTARSLLTYGFARDLLARVPVAPVRAKLDELLLARLPNGPEVREALHDIQ